MQEFAPGHHQRGQVLIIMLVGTLLLGASAGGLNSVFGEPSLKSMRKELKVLVTDEERRQRLDRILDDMEGAGKRHAGGHKHQGGELLALMSRHDATPAEFERLIGEVDSTNLTFRQTLLDLRDELRNSVSADEWRLLFAPPANRHAP